MFDNTVPLLIAGALAVALGIVANFSVHRVPKLDVKHKTVVITGGSIGIGYAMAVEFCRRGAHVVLIARRKELLETAVTNIKKTKGCEKATITYFVCDVTAGGEALQRNLVQPTCKWSAQQTNGSGSVDILVCNAGFSYPARFQDIPEDKARSMMDVNFWGSVDVVRQVLPVMHKQNSGRIVLVSSMTSGAPVAGFTMYAATKSAIKSFAAALDMENAARGIRVQVLNPPGVATPGFALENQVKSEEWKEICAMGGATPFTSEQVAEATGSQIENYKFQIYTGFDGFLLRLATAGMDPPTSSGRLLLEVALSGIVRLVAPVYTKLHYGIVRSVLKRQKVIS